MYTTNINYLIIPDIHHRWKRAEEVIKEVGPDITVFLGDYFDEFYDTKVMQLETAEWFKESLSKPNRIHLMGNHEMNYYDEKSPFLCSGYAAWKPPIICKVLKKEDWLKTRFHTWADSWLLTHAGLSMPLAHPYGKHKEMLAMEEEKAKIALMSRQGHWFWQAGARVDPPHPWPGGIMWNDFYMEHIPIPELNQIFGHTNVPEPIIKAIGKGYMNICLDTAFTHYITLLNNVPRIHVYDKKLASDRKKRFARHVIM